MEVNSLPPNPLPTNFVYNRDKTAAKQGDNSHFSSLRAV